MAIFKRIETKERFMGKLGHGVDLLEELNGICRQGDVRLGRIEGLGAVQKARLAYYHQDTRGI